LKKSLSYALVVVLLLSVLVGGPNLGPYGVDVVSAATGETAPAPAAPTKAAPTKAAPTKAAPVAATAVTRLLVEGSFGSEVKLLQTILNDNGYILKVDGFFGKKTAAAVQNYQSKNGLKADGIVGPKTLAKLVPAKPATPAVPAKPATPAVDAVSTASIVDNTAAFEKAIGSSGTWIIATLKDIIIDKDIVLEGEYKNGKKDANGKDIIQRKIALYTQDANRNVTARFTLTAPKLTINSPQASIQHGTF
jgi:peptidoglycan hydrolase-like protein with peptidoglycan-binding domain